MKPLLFVLALSAFPPCPMVAQVPAARAAAIHDDQTLAGMLVDLGYQPKKLSHGYLILVEKDGWKMYVQLRLSDDGTKLGMNANLGDVDESKVTADQWKGLLIANAELDPTSLNYDEKLKRLFLHRVLDNRDITPEFLKNQCDHFLDDIRTSEKWWGSVTKS